MLSDRVFRIAIMVSLALHGVLLLGNPSLNVFSLKQKQDTVEVSYIKETKKPLEEKKQSPSKMEPFLRLPPKITVDKKNPPPFMEKREVPGKNSAETLPKPAFEKPIFAKPDIIAVKKRITLPPVGLDKINNPSYISYYQIVREKIRRASYQNYTRTETGEVYLSFIISSDGYLKETLLSESKSSASPYLRAIALRSLKDASPFPKFPKELDYPQLSFNIVISFEIE